MTGAEVVSIVEKLADKLGTTGDKLVQMYVPWVTATAWCFVALGVAVLVACIIFSIALWVENEGDDRTGAVVCVILGILVCGAFIGANIPDIVAPQAAAVSKVLGQIR